MIGSRAYENKRDFQRLELDDCPVHYHLLDGGSEGRGTVKNLSASGLLMMTESAPPVGARLQVNIRPERALVPPFEAQGEVVRAESTEQGYAVAIRLDNG